MAKCQAIITKEYDAVRDDINTGDIILFSGKSRVSSIIKLFSRSPWSHVGMAVRMASDQDVASDLVLLWESTMLSDIPDFDTHNAVKGVRLVVLSETVKKYGGTIALRHLQTDRTPEMLQKLWKFRDEARGRPYEENTLELIKSAYDGLGGENSCEDLSSLFCSELVAATYQAMGLLPSKPVASEYTPHDFSTLAREPLALVNATLGEELLLRSK
jgi:hypothetical protein